MVGGLPANLLVLLTNITGAPEEVTGFRSFSGLLVGVETFDSQMTGLFKRVAILKSDYYAVSDAAFIVVVLDCFVHISLL